MLLDILDYGLLQISLQNICICTFVYIQHDITLVQSYIRPLEFSLNIKNLHERLQ